MAGVRIEKLYRWCRHWGFIALVVAAVVFYETKNTSPIVQSITCPSSTPQSPLSCDPCKSCDNPPQSLEYVPFNKLDIRLGRWDATRTYKLFDHAVTGEMFSETSMVSKVTLATQSSVERIAELLDIGAHWSGPISVAVFVAEEDLEWMKGFFTWIYFCQPALFARLSVHIAMPLEKNGNLIKDYREENWFTNCNAKPTAPATHRSFDLLPWKKKHPYPQNHLRNLARKNSQTPFVYLVDIDIIPSIGMSESLEKFFEDESSICKNCAYVIPTYELDKRVAKFPANKSELLRLAQNKLAIPFHKKVFIYNQYASNFSSWESFKGDDNETHVSHDVTNFEFLYEPFYVSSDLAPPHEERFVGYGFTRNTQVYEMFLVGYKFKVLSPVFTIHWGVQARKSRPSWRNLQNQRNYELFKTFQKELFVRYNRDPLHLLIKKPGSKKKS